MAQMFLSATVDQRIEGRAALLYNSAVSIADDLHYQWAVWLRSSSYKMTYLNSIRWRDFLIGILGFFTFV